MIVLYQSLILQDFGTSGGNLIQGAGYAQINGEIIYYSSITAGVSPAGSLGIGSRGVDSIQQAHAVGTQIFPYELNGVGLNRINNQHIHFHQALY